MTNDTSNSTEAYSYFRRQAYLRSLEQQARPWANRCDREGCSKPIPENRLSDYCSDACALADDDRLKGGADE